MLATFPGIEFLRFYPSSEREKKIRRCIYSEVSRRSRAVDVDEMY